MKQGLFLIFLLFFKIVIAFGQNTDTLFKERAGILTDIISKLEKKLMRSNAKKLLTGIIDTRYRTTEIVNNYAYIGLRFSVYAIDSQMTNYVSKNFMHLDLQLFDFTTVNAQRNEIMRSSFLFDRDSCKQCSRLYFEIGSPVEGWENIAVQNLKKKANPQDSAYIEKYYTNQVSIPVFIYVLENGKQSKRQFVFIYDVMPQYRYRFRKYIEL